MTVPEKVPPEAPLPEAPYVGVRPFERNERAIFRGRDRDAALLRDKVLSARLTILFGASGSGKSSVLRALLIPGLEDRGARVLYCDAWRGEDPLATLRAKLVEEARRLDIPDPEAGSPSLLDLLRLLRSVDGRTPVLVLDQFEELFTAQGAPLDSFRKELGGLVRASGVDVHIVLSLREEHLAALEPFRSEVLDLFHSTYRLVPLSALSAREAIEHPLVVFGASYEPELVEEMERELIQEQQKPGVHLGGEQVEADLPRLQLVCDELWKEAKRRQVKTLSRALYRELGGRQGIIESYLGKVMPHTWREQRLTARLLQHLAPRIGHKVPYSADSLASLTGFPLVRVRAELQRLTEARVLRSQQYGAGGVLYELWHDSFIRILAPWRDRILRRDRVWRWSRNAAGVLLVVLAAAPAVIWWRDRQERLENTTAVWDDKERSIEQKFDHVAFFLLWARGDDLKTPERLREELEAHKSLLPSAYGVDNAGLEFVTLPGEKEDWPLTLSYSSERKLEPQRFTQTWQALARYMQEEWGIPVPAKVKLVPKYAYPKELMTLTGPQIEPLALKVPTNEQNALLSEEGLSEPGMRFLYRFKSVWQPVPQAARGGPFWIVPRWSLPVWKASGTLATDGSGLPAFLLLLELQKSPERMLTPEAVEALLDKAAESHPLTVAEARAARGERLTQDLREHVKKGSSLNEWPLLLDLLADHPEGSSAELAKELMAFTATGPLHGPHVTRPPGSAATASEEGAPPAAPNAYQEVMPNLSVSEPAIRVYMGKRLEQAWTTPQGELVPLQQVEAVRAGLLRRFGIVLPGVRFRGAEWSPDLPPDSFQIVMVNETPADVTPVSVGKGDALQRLEAVLTRRAVAYRDYFVSAEGIDSELGELKQRHAGLHTWLAKHYSLTDLKRLQRAVLEPSSEELDALETKGNWEPVEVPPEKTVRHPAWLLGSLLFWSKLHEPYSLELMAEDLRKTQRARLMEGPASMPEDSEVAKWVEAGVLALDEGRIREAEAAFSQAIGLDRGAAEASFLAHYARRQPALLVRELARFCEPFQPRRSREGKEFTVFQTPLALLKGDSLLLLKKRVDLEELMSAEGLASSLDSATARRLRLCLLAALPQAQEQERQALARQLQEQHGSPEDWPADDAAWFGKEVLEGFDPLSGDSATLREGLAYLESGFHGLEQSEAAALFPAIMNFCRDPGPTLWCWNRLVPALAGAREDPLTLLLFADALSRRVVQEDAKRVLTLAAQAKERLRAAALPAQERQNLLDWADLLRARTLDTLAGLGSGGDDAEEEALLQRLKGSRALGALPTLFLARLRQRQNRPEEALAILDAAMKKWPEVLEIDSERLNTMLVMGDENGVSQVAAEALQKARLGRKGRTREDQEALGFIAATGLLMTKAELWEQAASEFLETQHENVPYVAMLLYSRLPEASREVGLKAITDLWEKARPDRQARLREGDASAWREMLIGYYLGKKEISHEQIFADLEDVERFDRSDLRNVPMSRLGMLCEAYFYDALLAEARGDMARRNSSLEKTVGTGQTGYYEYAMARFLLAQEGVGGSGP